MYFLFFMRVIHELFLLMVYFIFLVRIILIKEMFFLLFFGVISIFVFKVMLLIFIILCFHIFWLHLLTSCLLRQGLLFVQHGLLLFCLQVMLDLSIFYEELYILLICSKMFDTLYLQNHLFLFSKFHNSVFQMIYLQK